MSRRAPGALTHRCWGPCDSRRAAYGGCAHPRRPGPTSCARAQLTEEHYGNSERRDRDRRYRSSSGADASSSKAKPLQRTAAQRRHTRRGPSPHACPDTGPVWHGNIRLAPIQRRACLVLPPVIRLLSVPRGRLRRRGTRRGDHDPVQAHAALQPAARAPSGLVIAGRIRDSLSLPEIDPGQRIVAPGWLVTVLELPHRITQDTIC